MNRLYTLLNFPEKNVTWLLRYWLGIMMMYHSHWVFFEPDGLSGFADYLSKHGFPIPYVMAIISKSIEFFGGILLILGIGTRVVAFLMASVLGVAVFYMHKGLFWSEGELAFNYFLMAIVLFLMPSIPFHILKNKCLGK